MKLINNIVLIALMTLVFTGCGKKTEEKSTLSQKKTQHIVQNKKGRFYSQGCAAGPIVTQSLFQVIFNGTVLGVNDGQPVSNFYFSATPRGLYKKAGSPGHFSGNIAPDVDGKFVLSNLLEATYTLKIVSDNFRTFETNIFLCEREVFVDFSLVPFKNITIKGKVTFEETGEIVPDITVKFLPAGNQFDLQSTNKPLIKTKTDVNGRFSFAAQIKKYSLGTLIIDEPGYARVKYNITKNYPGEEIPILLRNVSFIKGVVKTPDGKPVSNIIVRVRNDYFGGSKFVDDNSFSKKLDKSIYTYYVYEAIKPTDASGEFVISNVAAPETYFFTIKSDDYFIPLLYKDQKSIKINKKSAAETELTVFPKSKVFLKVLNKENKPELNYILIILTRDDRMSSSYTKQVSLSSDIWYRVKFPDDVNNNCKLSLTATTDDEKIAATNGVIIVAGETNFITMVSSSESQISGFVYYPDDTPAVDVSVSAQIKRNESYKYTHTDYLGYFEFAGLLAKSNDTVRIAAYVRKSGSFAETNVPVGSQDVVIYLSPLPKIFGRVSLDYSGNSATNFTISISHWKTVAFHNDKGKFSINMSSNRRQGTNFIYVTSSGYAPKKIYFDFIKNKTCNLGEIILSGKPATITGRVVDQNDEPISAFVYLLQEDSEKLNVRTDSEGEYTFIDLPIEPVKIRAHNFHGTVESGIIHPSPDKITKVPDLVVYNTNAVIVEITFILPSGDYAADALVQNIGKTTDGKGTIKKLMRYGEYKNWRILYEDKIYRAEDFYVSSSAKKLRVKLIGSSEMKVTFFLDGKPMKKDYIRYYFNGGNACEDIPDGTLVINNLPGKYVFYNERHKIAIVAELYEDENNIVNFITEKSSLEVELPYKASWQVNAMLIIGGVKADVGSSHGENDISQKVFFKNIPAGEYELYVYCSTPSAKTNFTMRTTAY